VTPSDPENNGGFEGPILPVGSKFCHAHKLAQNDALRNNTISDSLSMKLHSDVVTIFFTFTSPTLKTQMV
jgi:hypothetical protein